MDLDFWNKKTVDGVVEDGEGGIVGVDIGEGSGDMFGIKDGGKVVVNEALELVQIVGDWGDKGLHLLSALINEKWNEDNVHGKYGQGQREGYGQSRVSEPHAWHR